MLDQMREQSGSFIIWILFAIIIASFVLFFGSPSDSIGCGAEKEFAMEVGEEEVSVHAWRYAYQGVPILTNQNIPGDQRRPIVLDLLIQREILAQAAEELEFQITDEQIDAAIGAGEFYMLGTLVAGRFSGVNRYFDPSEGTPFFSYQMLENHVGALSLPNVRQYKIEQRRDMMAFLMREAIVNSVQVSEDEARASFVQNNTRISAEYVKFEPQRYRSLVKLSEEAIAAFAKDNADKIKTAWETEKGRWETETDRVKFRIIKIARKTLDPEAPEKIQMVAIREKIAGGEDFAALAMEHSSDASAPAGGLVGWRAASSMGFGTEVVEAAKELKKGELSEVIESLESFYLVKIEDRSNKALSLEDKSWDIAARLAPEGQAEVLAKTAAEEALAAAATTPLSDLFDKEVVPPSNGLPPELMQQLTPEQIEQLMESMKDQESGAILRAGDVHYASSEQEGDEDAKPAATAKPATPKPAVAPKPAKETKTATAAEEAKKTSAAEATASTGAADGYRPALESLTGATRNGDFIAGIGRSKELVADLFGTLGVGSLATKVYEVSDSEGYVVIRLTDRSEADMEQFKEESSELRRALALGKGQTILNEWLLTRCEALRDSGKIKVNPAMLQGKDGALPYQACAIFQ